FDRVKRFWDVSTGQELEPKRRPCVFADFALSPDGRTFAPTYAAALGLYDLATGEERQRVTGHARWVKAGGFSADGKPLGTGGAAHRVGLWDVATGKELGAGEGHSSYVSGVAFLGDGRTVATSSWDKTVRLWDARTGRELRRYPHPQVVTSV